MVKWIYTSGLKSLYGLEDWTIEVTIKFNPIDPHIENDLNEKVLIGLAPHQH